MNRALALVFGLLFLTVGLVLSVGSWGGYRADTRIMEEGLSATARVTNISPWFDEDGKVQIEYFFKTMDGAEVSRSYSIDRADARKLKRGDNITVHYHPDNPKRSFPQGYGMLSQPGAVAFSLFGLVFVAFGVALVIGGLRIPR